MRLKEALAQANGWQRIFAVIAGVWTLFWGLSSLVLLFISFFAFFYPAITGVDGRITLRELGIYVVGGSGVLLLYAVIPPALLYALGYAVAWIRRGFQDTSKQ